MDQLFFAHNVTMPVNGDFLVDGKYTFEVGGKNKTFPVINTGKNIWIAADDIETGNGKKIPLWLLGFLY